MLLSTRDLQKILNIGRDRAYALMHAAAFPSMKVGGRYYVYEPALKEWLEKYKYKEFIL